MIEIHPQSQGNLIGMTVNGKLLKEDYETFIPKLEQMIADYGAIRCLIEITDMKGVELGAIWHEIKFDTKALQGHRAMRRCRRSVLASLDDKDRPVYFPKSRSRVLRV